MSGPKISNGDWFKYTLSAAFSAGVVWFTVQSVAKSNAEQGTRLSVVEQHVAGHDEALKDIRADVAIIKEWVIKH